MRFVLSVDGKDMVLTELQLDSVISILNGCEELMQVYKGDHKGTRGTNNQYVDELRPMDPRGTFSVKVVDENYYDTIKLVAKLAKES